MSTGYKYIRIMSDLHLNNYIGDIRSHPLLEKQKDSRDTILIIAGDIIDNLGISDDVFGKQPLQEKIWDEFLKQLNDSYGIVILVLGNHDHFFSNIYETEHLVKEKIKKMGLSNIVLLENEKISFDGLTIIGCTLWTSFNNNDPKVREMAERIKPDFRKINGKSGKLTVEEVYQINSKSKTFIKDVLESHDELDESIIVITHNAPCYKSIDDRFKANIDVNFLYYEDMTKWINKSNNLKLWVHGHTHMFNDYTIKKTRVVCNPYGNGNHDNTRIGFRKDFRVSVDELLAS